MNYNGTYRSNSVTGDLESIENLIVNDDEDPSDNNKFALEGTLNSETIDGEEEFWFGSSSTTFAAYTPDYSDRRTKQFLEEIAKHIDEPLIIRSVGHTGLRHIPDAWQYTVYPGGPIERHTFPEPSELPVAGNGYLNNTTEAKDANPIAAAALLESVAEALRNAPTEKKYDIELSVEEQ